MNRFGFESVWCLPAVGSETLGRPCSHSESIFCLEKCGGCIFTVFIGLV